MTQVGSIIDGKYRVIDKIGEGGMSIVWLVTDSRLNKQWAIKEIKKNARTETHKVIVKSLRDEANLMKGLDHPALPRIVDIIEDGDSLYVVMDFIQGDDLLSILKNKRRVITEEDVVDWGIQLCDALTYLHSKGIVYRDMKPGNVMLMADGTVKIIDFGIAREYSPDKEDDTMPLGTRGYASPEAFKRGVQTTPVSDIYSLGVTLFHLVTGHGPMEYVDQPTLPPIRMINPSLSEGLEYVIIKATQWNPADRYQSCVEMRYDLENLDKLTSKERRRLERIMFLFKLFTIAGAACLVLGVASLIASNLVRSSSYDGIMTRAATADTTEVGNQPSAAEELYMQAIEISPNDIKSYMRLVDTNPKSIGVYIADDNFSTAESSRWNELYHSNEGALSRSNDYAKLCYNVGLDYLLCFDYDKKKNADDSGSTDTESQELINTAAASKSVEWFKRARENAAGSTLNDDEKAAIEAYYVIGDFANRIPIAMRTGTEAEVYTELFDALETACNNMGEETGSMARLRLYDVAFRAIESASYLGNFANRAQISQLRVENLLEVVYKNVASLEQDALMSAEGTRLYNDVMDNYDAAKDNIGYTYNSAGRREGGSTATATNKDSSSSSGRGTN